MSETINPAAGQHLPSFITAPGQTDVLMIVTAVVLLLSVLAFGVIFLHLHTLPERVAHKSQKVQFEIVAILGLLALFTHIHIFWVAGLLLAFVDLPDVGGFLRRIARSVEEIAGIKEGGRSEAESQDGVAMDRNSGLMAAPTEGGTLCKKNDDLELLPVKEKSTPSKRKETAHA